MLGHSVECAKHYRQQMIDAGFVNVQAKLYKWPINAWPKDVRYKEIGEFFMDFLLVSGLVWWWLPYLGGGGVV